MKKDFQLNKYLEKIDNYFDTKTSSMASLINLGAFLVIAYVVYALTFIPADDFYEENNERYENVSNKLDKVNAFLSQVQTKDNPNFAIDQKLESLTNQNLELDNFKAKNVYFDTKLKELSYLLFNEENWANFLDDITRLAQENNIKVLKITSDIKEPNIQKIEQVLNINLEIRGNFNNILNYINSIEESKLVVDVNNLKMESDKNEILASMKISVWGMKY